MDNQSMSNEENELEQNQYLQMIIDIRKRAFMQILYGLLWWMGTVIAMYFALTSTGGTIYWYGGALGSLFHWYRAFKMIKITQEAGAKALIQNEAILIAVTVALVVFSTAKIVPEYFRIETPTIGTCWAKAENGYMVPVACWTSGATDKTISFADTAEACPTISTGYFDPTASEARFTCLIEN